MTLPWTVVEGVADGARHGVLPGDGLAVAVAWYELDLREPGWLRPAVEEAEALFEKMDLTGPFWALR